MVSIRRDWLAIRRCHDRLSEAFDLNTSVIDIELGGHLGASRHEHPGESIADSGPPSVPKMKRPSGIRRDELDVKGPPGQRGHRAVGLGRLHDATGSFALGRRLQPDIDEAWLDRLCTADSGG